MDTKICPICNGLVSVFNRCPYCHEVLTNGGKIEDYYGPYSPYRVGINSESENGDLCVHLLYCNLCGFDRQLAFLKIYP